MESPWYSPCQHLGFQVFENDLNDQVFSVLALLQQNLNPVYVKTGVGRELYILKLE